MRGIIWPTWIKLVIFRPTRPKEQIVRQFLTQAGNILTWPFRIKLAKFLPTRPIKQNVRHCLIPACFVSTESNQIVYVLNSSTKGKCVRLCFNQACYVLIQPTQLDFVSTNSAHRTICSTLLNPSVLCFERINQNWVCVDLLDHMKIFLTQASTFWSTRSKENVFDCVLTKRAKF